MKKLLCLVFFALLLASCSNVSAPDRMAASETEKILKPARTVPASTGQGYKPGESPAPEQRK